MARLLVGGQGLRLPARAVEAEHELGAQALAQGMLRDERLELADELGLAAAGELGLDPLLECGGSERLPPLREQAGCAAARAGLSGS